MFLILKTVNFVGKKTIEKSISDFDLFYTLNYIMTFISF